MNILKSIERSAKRLLPREMRKYFRASRYELRMTQLAPVDLIVHVGAHFAEDAEIYEGYGAETVLWIEADPKTYQGLQDALAPRKGATRHLTENALVSAEAGTDFAFNRFNGDGASSSVYTSTESYEARFPQSRATGEVLNLTSRALSEILDAHGIVPGDAKRAMLVVDVQGHELEVLRGLGSTLAQFELCKTEISRIPMYEGGALFGDVDAHMRDHGFKLISHVYALVPRHGDVLYRRA